MRERIAIIEGVRTPFCKAGGLFTKIAAEDLGASAFYAFYRVILPEILPGIITGFLFAVTLSIDDFVISFFTKGAGVSTLSVQIYSMARKGINPSINALSAIMFAAVMLMLIIIQKREKQESR